MQKSSPPFQKSYKRHNSQKAEIPYQQRINMNKVNPSQSTGYSSSRRIISPPPQLKLPFPPHIIPEDLINEKTMKLPSKPPNSFFIYRKAYTKELVSQNLRFKMTDVSPWVSISWKSEPEEVKTKYKEIAREVRKIYKKTKQETEKEKLTLECKNKNFQEIVSMLPIPTPPLNDVTLPQHLTTNYEIPNDNNINFIDNHHHHQNHIDQSYFNTPPLNISPSTDNGEFPPRNTQQHQHFQQNDSISNDVCQNFTMNFFENLNNELSYSEPTIIYPNILNVCDISNSLDPCQYVLDENPWVENFMEFCDDQFYI
nr:8273_t:CDS:1 [Entrophospora candida]CAG8636710.1 13289_t:CDS:1 [Entrophospora candida]